MSLSDNINGFSTWFHISGSFRFTKRNQQIYLCSKHYLKIIFKYIENVWNHSFLPKCPLTAHSRPGSQLRAWLTVRVTLPPRLPPRVCLESGRQCEHTGKCRTKSYSKCCEEGHASSLFAHLCDRQ